MEHHVVAKDQVAGLKLAQVFTGAARMAKDPVELVAQVVNTSNLDDTVALPVVDDVVLGGLAIADLVTSIFASIPPSRKRRRV